MCLLVSHIVKHSNFRLLGLLFVKHADLCLSGNTLTTFCLFYYQAVSKNDVLNLFFDTPRSLFAHNLSKVYGGATLVREISPEIRMRCRKNFSRPGFLPKYPDERREITLPSGLSPQKREPRAQSSAGEPSGFARRHCFESMAVVFAIDGACLPASVRLAYSPHAISLEFKLSKQILLLLTRKIPTVLLRSFVHHG